jgi:hypothetical protein
MPIDLPVFLIRMNRSKYAEDLTPNSLNSQELHTEGKPVLQATVVQLMLNLAPIMHFHYSPQNSSQGIEFSLAMVIVS